MYNRPSCRQLNKVHITLCLKANTAVVLIVVVVVLAVVVVVVEVEVVISVT